MNVKSNKIRQNFDIGLISIFTKLKLWQAKILAYQSQDIAVVLVKKLRHSFSFSLVLKHDNQYVFPSYKYKKFTITCHCFGPK